MSLSEFQPRSLFLSLSHVLIPREHPEKQNDARTEVEHSSRRMPPSPDDGRRLGKREVVRTTTLENSASHAMTLAAPASLSSLPLGRSTTASRSQDVAVSGVRQLSFAPPADDRIDDVDEDASTPYILRFHLAPRLRTEGIGHEAIERSLDFVSNVIASSETHKRVSDRSTALPRAGIIRFPDFSAIYPLQRGCIISGTRTVFLSRERS